jgi:hypothetical protein
MGKYSKKTSREVYSPVPVMSAQTRTAAKIRTVIIGENNAFQAGGLLLSRYVLDRAEGPTEI